MLLRKYILNGKVLSHKDKYDSLNPAIKSALEPNKGAKNHIMKGLAFRALFGHFPKSLVITTINHFPGDGSEISYYYF